MNYGYDNESKNWNEAKVELLVNRLVSELNRDIECIAGSEKPYIEVDGLYKGVRIRKITYLSEEQRAELVKKADKIYNEGRDGKK